MSDSLLRICREKQLAIQQLRLCFWFWTPSIYISSFTFSKTQSLCSLSVKAHFYLKPISLSLFIATHCSSNKKMREDSVLCCELEFWMFIIICVLLVLFAGITSGLTLGLLSFSQVELEVFTKAGRPQDQKYAGWHSFIFHYICAFSFNYAKKALSMFVDSLFFSFANWFAAKILPLVKNEHLLLCTLLLGKSLAMEVCEKLVPKTSVKKKKD